MNELPIVSTILGRVRIRPALLLVYGTAIGCSVDERGLRLDGGISQGSAFGATPSVGGGGASGKGGTDSQGDAQGGEGGAAAGGSGGSGGSATSGGSGVSGNGGGTVAGATGVAGTSGSDGDGGGSAGGAPSAQECGDFNDNDVFDCEETLVEDSTFDVVGAAWSAEPTLTQEWSARDSLGFSGSGALMLLSKEVNAGGGASMVGTAQCLAATGAQVYDFATHVWIDGEFGAGKAGINVWFYGGDGCANHFLKGASASIEYELDRWVVARGQIKSPAATRSMLVRLVAVKPNAQPSLKVLFDNVLVAKIETR